MLYDGGQRTPSIRSIVIDYLIAKYTHSSDQEDPLPMLVLEGVVMHEKHRSISIEPVFRICILAWGRPPVFITSR